MTVGLLRKRAIMPDIAFKDHVVVITGAAGGIARAIAWQLVGHGTHLALADIRAEQLNDLASELGKDGGDALALLTDVSDESQCRRLIEDTVATWGRVDMLILAAGAAVRGTFEDLPSLGLFQRVLDVHVLGSAYCTYYALPHLRKAEGRIVAMSSIAGKGPAPLFTSYAAAKHAVAGFYDSLRIELAGTGVSVTVAYPDLVATEFFAQLGRTEVNPLADDSVPDWCTERLMSAEKCAGLILRGAARRRREVLTSARGRALAPGMRLAAGIVDRVAKGIVGWDEYLVARSSVEQSEDGADRPAC
jgi:NAD(P)-dependent dehydrogenase (short-subunit alcohol dehydrogenase family)